MRNVTFDCTIIFKTVVHDGFTTGRVEHFCTHPDQAARRNTEFQMRHAGGRCGHGFGLTASRSDEFHHRANVRTRHIDFQQLVRFTFLAIDFADDDFRFADGKLKPFTTHRFDEHGQMQHTAAGDRERFFVFRFFDSQRHI